MKKKIVMLMLAAALAATAVAGCSKNNTSQEQDIASDAQEATMPDGAIDEAFGQPSEDETGDAAVQNSNRIYGVITDVSASEQTITVDNQSDVSSTGEIRPIQKSSMHRPDFRWNCLRYKVEVLRLIWEMP